MKLKILIMHKARHTRFTVIGLNVISTFKPITVKRIIVGGTGWELTWAMFCKVVVL